jgi:hypothetical protein
MKTLHLTLLLCFALPLVTFSQSNYRSGYIIKNNGDTIKGYINYREWSLSPKYIQFKSVIADKQVVVFNVPSLKSFTIDGADRYVSYIGPVSTGKTGSITDLSRSLDTSMRQDSAFLKIVMSGPNVELFYHADELKYRYFISEGASMPYELNFYQYLDENDRFISYAPFINQLDLLRKKYNNSNVNTIARVPDEGYKEDILINYIKVINNNKFLERSHVSGSRFFIGAAAAYNLSVFDGPSGFNYARTSSSVSPLIDAGVDFLNNPDVQKSFFRVEATFSSLSPIFYGSVGYFTSKQYVATIAPQVVINLYNTENFKYFIDLGVGITLTSVQQSKLVATKSGVIIGPDGLENVGESYVSLQTGQYFSNPYDVGSVGGNARIKTGIVINKHMELYLEAIPFAMGGSSNNYKNLGGITGFNYLFEANKK